VVDSSLLAGSLSITRGGEVEKSDEDLFHYLQRTLAARQVDTPALPFQFTCGYVGYFGYELKALCGGRESHRSPLPDCILLFVTRSVIVDHADNTAYLLFLGTEGDDEAAARWFDAASNRLVDVPLRRASPRRETPRFQPFQGRREYLDKISACLEQIRNGESYEICLTNRLSARTTVDPLEFYHDLRLRNPAPYAAYLKFPEVSVACSSPERFLHITPAGLAETKPIRVG
jgi:para-aminobenzoate synthetase